VKKSSPFSEFFQNATPLVVGISVIIGFIWFNPDLSRKNFGFWLPFVVPLGLSLIPLIVESVANNGQTLSFHQVGLFGRGGTVPWLKKVTQYFYSTFYLLSIGYYLEGLIGPVLENPDGQITVSANLIILSVVGIMIGLLCYVHTIIIYRAIIYSGKAC
jgi:hypothetical protein